MPISASSKFFKEDKKQFYDPTFYRSVIRALYYVIIIWPKISFQSIV